MTRRSFNTTRFHRLSEGSNFRTHSLFFNDAWRVGSQLTANLGVRWDKNHGLDQSGALVTKDSGVQSRESASSGIRRE